MMNISPGMPLLTKVANGINLVVVTDVEADGTVRYVWADGAVGRVHRDEIGRIGDTEVDYQFTNVGRAALS